MKIFTFFLGIFLKLTPVHSELQYCKNTNVSKFENMIPCSILTHKTNCQNQEASPRQQLVQLMSLNSYKIKLQCTLAIKQGLFFGEGKN